MKMMSKFKRLFVSLLVLPMAVLLMPNVKAEAAVSYPRIIIESYNLSADQIYGGDDTILTLTITNKSKKTDVDELLITYSSDVIRPVHGDSNQVYLESLAADSSENVEIPISIAETDASQATVTFNMEYTITDRSSSNGTSYIQQSNSAYIVFDIDNIESNLSITNISIPNYGTVDEVGMVSFNYSNIGSSDITDLTMTISGLNGDDISYEIGDIASGKSGYFEQYVSFEKTGDRNVSVYFSYKNGDGDTLSTNPVTYQVVVTELSTEDLETIVSNVTDTTSEDATATTTESTENVSNNDMNMSYVFLALAGALVLICIIFAIKNAKKK